MSNEIVKLRWFLVKARPRILYSILVGIVMFMLLSGHHPSTRFLIAWSCASTTYLILVFLMMTYFGGRNIAHLSKHEDDGEIAIYIISLLSGGASLVAIFIHVGGMKDVPLHIQELAVLMTGITFFTSWLVLHTAYSLHYAYEYYAQLNKDDEFTPLVFTGTKTPRYSDFFHFSIVIGMTCQTADIIIASSKIRSLVTIHSLISFAFNATLLGLTMSLVAGLMS